LKEKRTFRLLIIEDEAPVRSSLRDIFEMSGYKVFTAENGEEGIALAIELEPDLIICDVNMPGKDGFTVARELNNNESELVIPFIFLTARAELTDLREGMSLGADEYIFKPFRAQELLSIVNMRMERIGKFMEKGDVIPDKQTKILSKESRIMLEYKKNTELVSLKNIHYIEAESEYSNVYTSDGKKILVRKLLKEWHAILPEEIFTRVHRSSIVNLEAIEKFEKGFNNSFIIKVKNIDKTIIVSQRYSSILRQKFGI